MVMFMAQKAIITIRPVVSFVDRPHKRPVVFEIRLISNIEKSFLQGK